MRIIIVSDTHLAHESIGQLSGDVLIHCGDFALGPGARDDDIDRLDAWFARQRFGLILCIGGNHDFLLEDFSSLALPTFRHAVYLQDEMAVYRGMRFFGAPWVPELQGWAFYLSNDELRAKWAAAPHDTDVLITHSPPSGVLDRNRSGRHCGCPELFERVQQLRPKLHCFGHVHASSGTAEYDGTVFVNASMVDHRNQVVRKPYEIDL